MTSKPGDINAYIKGFPGETQKILEQIMATIKKTFPAVEETISYAIPAFKLNDQYLIYFAGYKNHVSLYPAPRGHDAFKEELSAYKGGKGTIQFSLDKPLPLELIIKIVQFRAEENLKKATKKNLVRKQ